MGRFTDLPRCRGRCCLSRHRARAGHKKNKAGRLSQKGILYMSELCPRVKGDGCH